MSKNNPSNRGARTKAREYKGKKVVPVLYVNPTNRKRYMAAAFEDGNLVIPEGAKAPIAYAKV